MHHLSLPSLKFVRWWWMLAMVRAAPPKSASMEPASASVGSDGTVGTYRVHSPPVDTEANPNAELLFEGTSVTEIETSADGWAAIEARATTRTAYVVFFYSPANPACVNAKSHLIDWVDRPDNYKTKDLKLKIVAVNCDRERTLCYDEGAQRTPHMTLYSPYVRDDASPEFFNGIYDAPDMAEWTIKRLHELRDESNRRQALTMIRRDDAKTYYVGDENEKVACFIHGARVIAIMMGITSLEEAAAEGLHDHPLKDLWGLPPDVNGVPAKESTGNCAEVATILRGVMDGEATKVAFCYAYKEIVARSFEMFGAPHLRWHPEDPYSELLISEKAAPSMRGTKVLRLCTGIGDTAPIEVWAQCLTHEGRFVMTAAKAKDEL
jgi:hypothetical protein